MSRDRRSRHRIPLAGGVTSGPVRATSSPGPGFDRTEVDLSLRAMHLLQERDRVEVTHAGSWPELLGVADGPGLAVRKLDVSRCRDVGQPLPRAGRRAGGAADRA